MGGWGGVVVASDALLSSSPSLIWLQLGFGLAGAVTIVPLDFRGFGQRSFRNYAKGLMHDYP